MLCNRPTPTTGPSLERRVVVHLVDRPRASDAPVRPRGSRRRSAKARHHEGRGRRRPRPGRGVASRPPRRARRHVERRALRRPCGARLAARAPCRLPRREGRLRRREGRCRRTVRAEDRRVAAQVQGAVPQTPQASGGGEHRVGRRGRPHSRHGRGPRGRGERHLQQRLQPHRRLQRHAARHHGRLRGRAGARRLRPRRGLRERQARLVGPCTARSRRQGSALPPRARHGSRAAQDVRPLERRAEPRCGSCSAECGRRRRRDGRGD
mmetsp:Transcript_5668/g.23540  ORF Transcript_5668/g.23540 Transcript_5668/m.23540 type:complete len:266 (-) Transcript_5668:1835-2632(-)